MRQQTPYPMRLALANLLKERDVSGGLYSLETGVQSNTVFDQFLPTIS